MAQTFKFFCALLLLGAFCGLTKTDGSSGSLIQTPDGGDATPAPTPDGGDATPAPTPDGGDATPAPTPDGGDATPAPTPDGGDATPAPTPDGGDATPAPTPDGGDATPAPTPDGGDATPASTPNGSDATPAPTHDGGDATPPPTQTPDSTATSTAVSGATSGTPQQTTAPPDACSPSPCGPGSTCESRAGGTFECLCLPGAYYNQVTCVTAKVFPGELTFGNIPFNESLTDKTSALFKNTSEQVTGRIDQVFEGDNNYLNSTVLEFRLAETRMQQTTAYVHIIFDLAATINGSTVFERIKNCTECNVTGAVLRTLCDAQLCDLTSTTCEAGDGTFTCRCNSGYITTNLTDMICIACPSGQKAVDNRCIDCPFGYSGFNCAEHWKLALVIVATVLGAVLLGTLIALVTVVVRSKKRSKASSTAAIGKPYNSHSPANSPLVNGSKGAPAMTGMPRIPRATAQNSAGFNLEMTPSNSRQNLVSSGGNSRHYDDVLAHGQNRPQSNPYTSNRGQDNPYYKYDGR